MKIKCPFCGKKHEINPAQLLVNNAISKLTPEQRRARVEKAIQARKLSTGKKLRK